MRNVKSSTAGCVSACLGAVFAICLALIAAPERAAAAEVDQWLSGVFNKSSSGSGRSNLGGPSEGRRQGRRSKGSEDTNFGSSFGSIFGGGGGDKVRYVASSGCLSSNLSGVISSVSTYGSVTVSSTCRSHSHNASVGGAKKSHHLTGDAADFRVHGDYQAAYAHLRNVHGGAVHHYGGGLFHIDNGAKRSW